MGVEYSDRCDGQLRQGQSVLVNVRERSHSQSPAEKLHDWKTLNRPASNNIQIYHRHRDH